MPWSECFGLAWLVPLLVEACVILRDGKLHKEIFPVHWAVFMGLRWWLTVVQSEDFIVKWFSSQFLGPKMTVIQCWLKLIIAELLCFLWGSHLSLVENVWQERVGWMWHSWGVVACADSSTVRSVLMKCLMMTWNWWTTLYSLPCEFCCVCVYFLAHKRVLLLLWIIAAVLSCCFIPVCCLCSDLCGTVYTAGFIACLRNPWIWNKNFKALEGAWNRIRCLEVLGSLWKILESLNKFEQT